MCKCSVVVVVGNNYKRSTVLRGVRIRTLTSWQTLHPLFSTRSHLTGTEGVWSGAWTGYEGVVWCKWTRYEGVVWCKWTGYEGVVWCKWTRYEGVVWCKWTGCEGVVWCKCTRYEGTAICVTPLSTSVYNTDFMVIKGTHCQQLFF